MQVCHGATVPQQAHRPGKFVKVHAEGRLVVIAALLAERKGRIGGVIPV